MKQKVKFIIPFVLLCLLMLPLNSFSMPDSDIRLEVHSPVNSLNSENGVVAVEHFPAEITISATAGAGNITEVELSSNGQTHEIPSDYILTIPDKKACGVYTLTAKTDGGAVLSISMNVVFQVKATYNIRYRTVGMNLKEVYDGDIKVKTFSSPQLIDLVEANTIAEYEQKRIVKMIGRNDGRTYTLKGCLVVEVYNYTTGQVINSYDTNENFKSLTTRFGWTPKSITAFETMRKAAITVVAEYSDDPTDPDDPNAPDPTDPDDSDDPTDPDDSSDDPTDTPKNPDDPENPDNPDSNNPVVPMDNLCDVGVTLSCPQKIYAQEDYSFIINATNNTDIKLSGVNLIAFINGKTVSIPSKVDIEANETKAFHVKGRAGEKDTIIQLSAKVSPPVQYKDTNTGNNRAEAKIGVAERPYDLDIQRITPDTYKENQTVISTVKVSNKGSLDFTPGQKVAVLFEIPELSVKKNINTVVMERDTYNIVSIKWDTPNVTANKNITLIAVINPDHVLDNEDSIANNTYTQGAVIKNVTYDDPEQNKTIPVPPERSGQTRVTWREQRFENDQFVWRKFYAELKVNATLDYDTKKKGHIKSGYGFTINVSTTVNTNYDKPELITVPQTAEVYLPEHIYETAIPLERDGNRFVFKENTSSPFEYRKHYVPIWFPDNRDYIIQLLVTDAHTPGGILSRWITGGDLLIKVNDSMYSDDVTTGTGNP